MIQAMSGGLEKYPSAGSSLHAQYCASSKNRSVPFVYSATTRKHNSAARPARSTENQLTSRLLVPGPGRLTCARTLQVCLLQGKLGATAAASFTRLGERREDAAALEAALAASQGWGVTRTRDRSCREHWLPLCRTVQADRPRGCRA